MSFIKTDKRHPIMWRKNDKKMICERFAKARRLGVEPATCLKLELQNYYVYATKEFLLVYGLRIRDAIDQSELLCCYRSCELYSVYRRCISALCINLTNDSSLALT